MYTVYMSKRLERYWKRKNRVDTRHFQSRAKERYNIDVNNAMLRYWVRQIELGAVERISSRPDKKGRMSHVYKLTHEDKPFYVVYREVDKKLITALPVSKFALDKRPNAWYTPIMEKIKKHLREFVCQWFHTAQHVELSRQYNNTGKHRTVECNACKRTWEEHWL